MTWLYNTLETAQIHSQQGKTCRLRSAWPVAITDDGQEVTVTSPGDDLYEFATEAGHTYTVTSQVDWEALAAAAEEQGWFRFR